MLEAELVGIYMIRPILSFERLTLMEPEGRSVTNGAGARLRWR